MIRYVLRNPLIDSNPSYFNYFPNTEWISLDASFKTGIKHCNIEILEDLFYQNYQSISANIAPAMKFERGVYKWNDPFFLEIYKSFSPSAILSINLFLRPSCTCTEAIGYACSGSVNSKRGRTSTPQQYFADFRTRCISSDVYHAFSTNGPTFLNIHFSRLSNNTYSMDKCSRLLHFYTTY